MVEEEDNDLDQEDAEDESPEEEVSPRRAKWKKDARPWSDEFVKAGEPDLENPATDLDYVRKLQMIVLHQMSKTPCPTKMQQAFWRRIKEMSAVCGMTSNRSQLESTVKRLKIQLGERLQTGTIRREPTAGRAKPDTARGMPRGPRPLPPDEPNGLP